jgi:hypothetical protein
VFTLKIKEAEDIAGYIKNPTMLLDFNITGINFENKSSDGLISESFKKLIKVKTKLDLETELLYEKGPFKNHGGVQPIIGNPTSYTVA